MFIDVNGRPLNVYSIVYWYTRDNQNPDKSITYAIYYRIVDGRVIEEAFATDEERAAKVQLLQDIDFSGGGGSGGTTNYEALQNKPQINNVTLSGNVSLDQLNLLSKTDTQNSLNAKLNSNLGSSNANKYLSTDESGNITAIDGLVTTQQLTEAISAESSARSKQDDLLQGEIDTKIAPANIKAGTNVTLSQSGLDVTINATPSLKMQVVEELPTQDIDTDTIYLLESTESAEQNVYDEYIYVNNAWEKIGNTSVDLSNYLSKTNTTAYTPTSDYNPATKQYVDSSIEAIDIPTMPTNYVTIDTEQSITAKKTFTTLPESSVTPTSDNQLVNKAYVDNLLLEYSEQLNAALAKLTTPQQN